MSPTFDLKWAQTMDGQLCDDRDLSQWITGAEELKETHRLRAGYDAVVVGAETFLKDRCQLTVRHVELAAGETQPIRIIIDGRSQVLSRIEREDGHGLREALADGPRKTLILSSRATTVDLGENVTFLPADLDFSQDPEVFRARLFSALAEGSRLLRKPLQKFLVEGGPRLLTVFLKKKIYSQVFISIAPIFTGGQKHRIFLGEDLSSKLQLQVKEMKTLGADRLFVLERAEL